MSDSSATDQSSPSDPSTAKNGVSLDARLFLAPLAGVLDLLRTDMLLRMDDADRQSAIDLCEEATRTNCGWHEYEAAQILLSHLQGAPVWREERVARLVEFTPSARSPVVSPDKDQDPQTRMKQE